MGIYYSNCDLQEPHMTFIGRWSPLHKGHTWIIEQQLKNYPNKPVLIFVRNTSFDEFTAEERAEMVKQWFVYNEIKGTIFIIPDIEGVYYGRGVGYNVEELVPPENIKVISATDIRNRIKAGDEQWKEIVAPGTAKYLETILKEINN